METVVPTPFGGGVPVAGEEPQPQPGEARLLPGVTAVIPTIPPRRHMFLRAIASVAGQSRPPDSIAVALDTEREGAAITRDRALWTVRTEWTAFLDDDDEWGRFHLQRLLEEAARTGADLVFPWFTVVGGADPFPMHEGKVWDIGPENLEDFRHIPITVLVKTRLMFSIGGFAPWGHHPASEHPNTNEDLGAFTELCRRGAHIVHLNERTWMWHHHGGNLSGKPTW